MELVARATKRSKRAPKIHKFKTVYRSGGSSKPFIPIGMPRTHLCKLRFALVPGAYQTMASTSYMSGRVFRLNSIYDPDYTGGGDQPRFRDQLAEFYDSYQVLGAKVDIDFYFANGSTSNSTSRVYLRAATTETVATVPEDVLECRHKRSKMLTAQYPTTNLKMFWSARKMFGIPKKTAMASIDGMVTETGTNPTNANYLAYLHVGMWNNTSANQTIYYGGTIEYIVRFSGYKLPQQS